ncbi:MAG: aspartate/glutamate racemase family protein [Aestuariibacter sp.]
MKTIGLIGGMSWQSTTGYYQHINRQVAQRLGGLHSAKLLLSSLDFAPIAAQQANEQWSELGELMTTEARRLENAGAQAVLIGTNTMHFLAEQVQANINIPLLHIADAAGQKLNQIGVQHAGLLGTAFTMNKGFYKIRLQEKFGIAVTVPDAPRRADIHRIIYDELCHGTISSDSRAIYVDAVNDLVKQGCKAIVMGCTEIGLLLRPQDAQVPLLDTTTLHCEMAVDFMLQ